MEAGELGRGLIMRYEEAARPLVAFPGMDELLICQDEELHRVGRIEDIHGQRCLVVWHLLFRARSIVTKLYNWRGQKVMLEDMDRVKYYSNFELLNIDGMQSGCS